MYLNKNRLKFWTKFYIKYRRGKELMVLDLLHRLVTSFYPERVKIYTLKNAIEAPFLGTCRNQKSFYILGVPISRPQPLLKYIFRYLYFSIFKQPISPYFRLKFRTILFCYTEFGFLLHRLLIRLGVCNDF